MRLFHKQVLLLTLLSWLAVAPGLWSSGTNIVTDTYERAADLFWSRGDLYGYPNGKGDWFKYSPLFAGLYGGFAALPPRLQATAWALLGAWIFWAGICAWFVFNRHTSWFRWGLVAAVSIELDSSLRYQQINALIVGLILLGLAALRHERPKPAAFCLALATNFKVVPLLIGALAAFPRNRKYFAFFVLVSIALVVCPALWLGPLGVVKAMGDWAALLLRDIHSAGLVDLESTLAWWGWPKLGTVARWAVVCTSLAVLIRSRFYPLLDRSFPWGAWFATAMGCLLLYSPRTESPTFIWIAPALLFFGSDPIVRWPKRVFLLGIAFFLSVSFSDLWPKAVWDPRTWRYSGKVAATFALWLWGVYMLLEPTPSGRLKRFFQHLRT
jgi:hypothetical protein